MKRARADYDARRRELGRKRAAVLRKVTRACDVSRARLSSAAKERRRVERERLNREIEAMRAEARAQCDARRARVRRTVKDAAELAARERDERIRLARELSGIERKAAKKIAAAERRRERRELARESDDEVSRNIDPELVPLWEQIKGGIRATPRKSRTESFLEWVEENQDEIWAMREQQAAAELEELAQEQAAYYAEAVPF